MGRILRSYQSTHKFAGTARQFKLLLFETVRIFAWKIRAPRIFFWTRSIAKLVSLRLVRSNPNWARSSRDLSRVRRDRGLTANQHVSESSTSSNHECYYCYLSFSHHKKRRSVWILDFLSLDIHSQALRSLLVDSIQQFDRTSLLSPSCARIRHYACAIP